MTEDNRRPRRRLGPWWWPLGAAWLAGAVIVWNGVFDAYITAGARGYVERQQAFIAGRGPRADMDEAMDAARRGGLWAATAWTAAELAPACAIALWLGVRRRSPAS